MSTELDERIREVVTTIGRSAPAPRTYAELRARTTTETAAPLRPPRRAGLVAAVGALAVVGVATIAIALVSGSGPPGPNPGSATVAVRHHRIEYRATPNDVCEAAEAPEPGRYRESRIDVWVDDAGHRARMRTTYPDGSTRDLVTLGNGPAPEQRFVRGDDRSDLVGCGFGSGTFIDPGADAAIPPVGAAVPESAHRTIVPGEHRDSLGRDSELWTISAPGSIDAPGSSVDLVDESRLFVDPATHHLLEHVVTTRWETGATVVHRVTYRNAESTTVESRLFSTDGFRDISAAHSSATTSTTSPSPGR